MSVGEYFFDEEVDRTTTPSLKHRDVGCADQVFAGSVADMDFKAPPAILSALRERLEHGIFGYECAPADLYPSLIDWMARRHGWVIAQEAILRAPTVLNTTATAVALFTAPGDGVLIQPPVFADFYATLRAHNLHIVENPLLLINGRYYMDFDDLEVKASYPTTRIMFLCNPHNPVGRLWTAEELMRAGEICHRHGVLVVSDEMHADLVLPGYKYTPFASLGPMHSLNSITCLSPAKAFNIASCCSSFAIIPDEIKRELFVKENSRLNVNKNNALANTAMLAAYQQGEPWLEALRLYLQGNVDLFKEHLRDIPSVRLIEPEGTFLIWVDFRDLKLNSDELKHFIREEVKWVVHCGDVFGIQGTGFARVNIACTRARLSSALISLKRAIAQLKVE